MNHLPVGHKHWIKKMQRLKQRLCSLSLNTFRYSSDQDHLRFLMK